MTEAKEEDAPIEVFRKDYKPPDYFITKVSMDFDLNEGETFVSTVLAMKRAITSESSANIMLDGETSSIKLLSLSINGNKIDESSYKIDSQNLVINVASLSTTLLQEHFTIETKVQIIPEENTALSGLYKTSGVYCTQCEAMGFRRITYYLDRPDVMAVFEKVRIEADKKACPILLSNGNLLEKGDLENARHYAIWEDPFPKPSYLFALVAGDLGSVKDTFTTCSGREVKLEIFSEKENVNQLDHAMNSLKLAMKWDEDTFGLEYDLDLYNIVAVSDFNMGAMENKGLNVFNTSCVLASQNSATDANFEHVQRVIAHEYFHNWTGNRVTCRDWFQLTLKEGLTVYRDQCFSSDQMDSPAVKRIDDVKVLRVHQFAEDAGPLKHPIRPESYIRMDNFYTVTVYNKGAEIIRMYQTLLTKEGFRKGMDLYFERNDGKAVDCDDFRSAMADANSVSLEQFGRWYSTPGTPTVKYSVNYVDGELKLTFEQESLSEDGPLHIPILVGALDGNTGEEILTTTLLELKEKEQSFTFSNLNCEKVIPSILRNFSAPIKLVPTENDENTVLNNWAFLAAYDTDDFNKWDSAQKLYKSALFASLKNPNISEFPLVIQAFERTLSVQQKVTNESEANYSIAALALTLPSEAELMEDLQPPLDPISLCQARKKLKLYLAQKCRILIENVYEKLSNSTSSTFSIKPLDIGRRRLRNVLLSYICCNDEISEREKIAYKHFTDATCLTDKLASLSNLVSFDDAIVEKEKALQSFYSDANSDQLVINKWFMVQALADTDNVLDKVKELTKHPDFTLKNPNRCRSLVSVFPTNLAHFHDSEGEGYAFLGGMIAEIDKINPQVASRAARSFMQWKKFDESRGLLMKKQLEYLRDLEGVSKDLLEIVSRGLK